MKILGDDAHGNLSAEPVAHTKLQCKCPHGPHQCTSSVAPMGLRHLCLSWKLEPSCLPLCVKTSLLAWTRATEQIGSSRGTLSWSLDLPGELPSEKTVTREEAGCFVLWSTRDWTRATQVICHLRMGLINGWRVGRGGRTARSNQIHTRVSRRRCSKCIFSQQWMLPFRFLLLLSNESMCVQST